MSVATDTVTSTLSFYVPPPEGVRAYVKVNVSSTGGLREKSYDVAPHKVPIENIRPTVSSYTLDKNGFQLGVHEAKHKTFANDEEIKKEYYPESEELLKKVTGASRVVFFDHST